MEAIIPFLKYNDTEVVDSFKYMSLTMPQLNSALIQRLDEDNWELHERVKTVLSRAAMNTKSEDLLKCDSTQFLLFFSLLPDPFFTFIYKLLSENK